jgi:hypothetical protein
LNPNSLVTQEKSGGSKWFVAGRRYHSISKLHCPASSSTYDTVMASEIFQASRWTHGNFLFPTVIEVTDQAVIRRKRSWFSRDEISISITKVASVHIKTGIIWADILIESSGGSDPLASHGHTKADARRIRELVETAQANPAGKAVE